MTPEELNRTIEFIVESQARLAAAQERDREDRIEFQEWSKSITGQVIQLLDHQSRRLDDQDRFYRDWLTQNSELQSQALRLLHLILDRLPPPQPA